MACEVTAVAAVTVNLLFWLPLILALRATKLFCHGAFNFGILFLLAELVVTVNYHSNIRDPLFSQTS